MRATCIAGFGHATPARSVSNEEIEHDLGLEPGWIERRTGIRSRRICAEGESCSTLAIDASARALARSQVEPGDVGLVLLATSTPDHLLPPTAPVVALAIGCVHAGAVDLAGACAGFLYAVGLADGYVRTTGRPAVVVASNVLSRRLDPRDPSARAIFADGAGAVVLTDTSSHVDGSWAILSQVWGSDGKQADSIRIRAGGSVQPIDIGSVEEGLHFLRIERGPGLFAQAVDGLVRTGRACLDACGISSTDVDLWVPHQANSRILQRAGARLEIEKSRWVTILEEWGNSSAASIPTALSLAAESGRIGKGKKILLTAVGAGLVEAAAVLEA